MQLIAGLMPRRGLLILGLILWIPASLGGADEGRAVSQWSESELAAGCIPDAHTLCLREGRFGVRIAWYYTSPRPPRGDGLFHEGMGAAIPLNAGSGTFWFFSPDNSEMLVKVLDGCGINSRYWVFFAATTSVGYSLNVADFSRGEVNIYVNVDGRTAIPVQDTDAFPCTQEPAGPRTE